MHAVVGGYLNSGLKLTAVSVTSQVAVAAFRRIPATPPFR
jgi:hypothetical protein